MRKCYGLIVVCLLVSCGLARSVRDSVDAAVASIAMTPVTVARIMGASVLDIYEKDSLESGEPAFLRRLEITCSGDSLVPLVRLDSMMIVWDGDSVINFKKVAAFGDSIRIVPEYQLPVRPFYVGTDSVTLAVRCEYLPATELPGNRVFKCMKAEYTYVQGDSLPVILRK